MPDHPIICQNSRCRSAIQATLQHSEQKPEYVLFADIVKIIFRYHQYKMYTIVARGLARLAEDLHFDSNRIESITSAVAKDIVLASYRELQAQGPSSLSVDQIHRIFFSNCHTSVATVYLLANPVASRAIDRLARRGADSLVRASGSGVSPGSSGIASRMRGLGKDVWQKLGGTDTYLHRIRDEWE